ncbi:MAG: VacJ family membrane protein [Candidatus Desulfovibrio kirbyi]|uniref:VacJ family membrane protein n=1 Tax=Candidatus Desulfovibrio kirbyi TaxID=2696086 RepID=A0A6L2R687_9BACT|nr:MAG: VacJ family membrane protein [Candidatus Desulfovibrio kirbyi]
MKNNLCVLLLILLMAGQTAAHAASSATLKKTPSTVYGAGPALPPGAVTVRPSVATDISDALDDYDTVPRPGVADPFEGWNRFWFRFNDIFYLYVAKPTYTSYSAIMPHQVRSGLKNFFHNLLFPVRFVNNLLQFRFMAAGAEFGRFIINTTTTLGFANVAKDKKTVAPVDPSGEDFGQTLGRWGIGHGFYIVWPLIGPSSARDTLGRAGDILVDPLFYVQPWELAAGTEFGLRFNDIDEVLPIYDDLKGAAVDPYISMREAYLNFRKIQVTR